MPKFTYKGLAAEDKAQRFEKQKAAIMPTWKVTTGMMAVKGETEINLILKNQEVELADKIAQIKAGIEELDKVRQIGPFVFEKGKPVEVPDDSLLLNKFLVWVELGIFEVSGAAEPAETPAVNPKKQSKPKKKGKE